jgi:hypothetical protein
MAKFNSKTFNPEAFGKYVSRIPQTKKNELIKSRALKGNAEIRNAFSAQTGTAYATLPMYGLLDGVPLNYDGTTDITATGTTTFERSVVVIGRAKAWTEGDFAEDITGGAGFMDNVAVQVAEYWDRVDQDTLLSILKGIFSMIGANNLKFVNGHTYDITGNANENASVGAATLNSAIQQAGGDNKSKFKLVIMHSVIATNLENLKLLAYLKQTDANGIERELALGTWNGRVVLIDDSMPVEDVPAQEAVSAVAGVKAVYTIALSTKAVAGDSLTLGDKIYVCGTTSGWSAGASTTADATALKALFAVDFPDYTFGGSGGSITMTQKVAKSEDVPNFAINKNDTNGTLAGTITETIEGVTKVAAKDAAYAYTKYTTYVLGEGAFDYENIGAQVPYEMSRDPKTNGGQDTLYSRQRKCLAPYGISYTKFSQATLSPTDVELEDGANWTLVNDGNGKYIDHKAIPIARIISKG